MGGTALQPSCGQSAARLYSRGRSPSLVMPVDHHESRARGGGCDVDICGRATDSLAQPAGIYIWLKWRVGPKEYVTIAEHWLVAGAQKDDIVRQRDRNPANNDPDNLLLVPVHDEAVACIAGAASWSAPTAPRIWVTPFRATSMPCWRPCSRRSTPR